MERQGVLVVDLDGVLFDAKKFKAPFFEMLGLVTGTDPVVAYEAVKKRRNFYDADLHFSEMARSAGRGDWMPRLLKASTFSLLKDNPGVFLTEDALDFLEEANRMFSKIVLATRGTEWFQIAKIESSGINTLVSSVFYVQEEKKSVIRTDINGCRIVFVDDTAEEINAFKVAHPEAFVIHYSPDMVALLANAKAHSFPELLKIFKALKGATRG